ncbi:C40 family peptidase [Demequina sp. SYSU T00192]|uniref:C40 family peptidase n=1 Tax=Demequina litoralis TaxID=3051660 RepID=A0ABT8G5G5_9MICO|nr:C40 family peptidase [Demequina sp. SYSU T00192]MDN4474374.1 C40 family peptidase [Demequina sp. SYSU T00192]
MFFARLPFPRRAQRAASATVAGGALSLGYATAALASPAGTPADASELPSQAQETVRTAELTVAPISADAEASWGGAEVPEVEVTPLWEQPKQIAKARRLASDPEVVTTAAVHLRADASVDADSLTVVPEGSELGTDADAVTQGRFTRVYTEDGLTGFIATRLLDDYVVEVEETAASTSTSSSSGSSTASGSSSTASSSTASSASYASIVSAALSQVGSAYAFASATPGAFDCSGLVSWAYAQVGKSVPHSSSAIRATGTVIPASAAQPGDIIWSPGHVSIYLGNGQQVEAVGPGSGVQQTSIWQSSPVFLRF